MIRFKNNGEYFMTTPRIYNSLLTTNNLTANDIIISHLKVPTFIGYRTRLIYSSLI